MNYKEPNIEIVKRELQDIICSSTGLKVNELGDDGELNFNEL